MLPRIFSEIVNGVWAMEKSYADAYIPIITNLIAGKVDPGFKPSMANMPFREQNYDKQDICYFSAQGNIFSVSEYGESDPPEEAPRNSIAIVNISDVIAKNDTACGPSGTVTKGRLLQRSDANPNIKGIILKVDSPGGEGYAARELSRIIRSIDKPVLAFVDDLSASAAYWISASADYIIANSEVAKIGSIGTYVTLADYDDFWKQQGIRLIEIYADKSTDKNKAYYEAIDKGDFTLIKKDINRFNDLFINSISEMRQGKLTKAETWGTGKLFDADQALELGLIDQIGVWEETIKSFATQLNI